MKTKFFLISLIAATLCMVSCAPTPNITPDMEKEIIKTIYQSLDLSPEMFGANITKYGLHEIPQESFGSEKYKTFANEDRRSANTVGVHIKYRNDTILFIYYERYLNKESNVAAYYKLFSDMIAGYDYTDWHGYYEDPDEEHNVGRILHGGNDYSYAQEAKDRNDLCDHINNECLIDTTISQYFAETFIYTHKDKSKWYGQTLMWSSVYFSGMSEDDSEQGCTKDIHLHFQLERQ